MVSSLAQPHATHAGASSTGWRRGPRFTARCSDEAGCWKNIGIDPSIAARALWPRTPPLSIGPVNSAVDRAESTAAGMDQVNAIGGGPIRLDDAGSNAGAMRYLTIVGQAAIFWLLMDLHQ